MRHIQVPIAFAFKSDFVIGACGGSKVKTNLKRMEHEAESTERNGIQLQEADRWRATGLR